MDASGVVLLAALTATAVAAAGTAVRARSGGRDAGRAVMDRLWACRNAVVVGTASAYAPVLLLMVLAAPLVVPAAANPALTWTLGLWLVLPLVEYASRDKADLSRRRPLVTISRLIFAPMVLVAVTNAVSSAITFGEIATLRDWKTLVIAPTAAIIPYAAVVAGLSLIASVVLTALPTLYHRWIPYAATAAYAGIDVLWIAGYLNGVMRIAVDGPQDIPNTSAEWSEVKVDLCARAALVEACLILLVRFLPLVTPGTAPSRRLLPLSEVLLETLELALFPIFALIMQLALMCNNCVPPKSMASNLGLISETTTIMPAVMVPIAALIVVVLVLGARLHPRASPGLHLALVLLPIGLVFGLAVSILEFSSILPSTATHISIMPTVISPTHASETLAHYAWLGAAAWAALHIHAHIADCFSERDEDSEDA